MLCGNQFYLFILDLEGFVSSQSERTNCEDLHGYETMNKNLGDNNIKTRSLSTYLQA